MESGEEQEREKSARGACARECTVLGENTNAPIPVGASGTPHEYARIRALSLFVLVSMEFACPRGDRPRLSFIGFASRISVACCPSPLETPPPEGTKGGYAMNEGGCWEDHPTEVKDVSASPPGGSRPPPEPMSGAIGSPKDPRPPSSMLAPRERP